MAEIRGIRGEYVFTPGEPVESVVEALEEMLSEAKAGQFHCFAAAYSAPDGVHCRLVGTGPGCALIGAIEMVKLLAAEKLNEGS